MHAMQMRMLRISGVNTVDDKNMKLNVVCMEVIVLDKTNLKLNVASVGCKPSR